MADLRTKLNGLYSLEQIAVRQSCMHRLHPISKLTASIVYIVCVMSFPMYALSALAPFAFYPFIVMSLGGVPWRMIFTRVLIALPFCLFAGVSSIIFDREIVMTLGIVPISGGVIACLSLIVRTVLCVSAVLVLVGVTPFAALTAQMRRLHIPNFMIMLFEMVYRYIGVLAEEALSMVTALRLRGNGMQWPDIRMFGSFVGTLLLRSIDRANRIYQAMLCRGYGLADGRSDSQPWKVRDTFFLMAVCGSSVAFRMFDAVPWLGGLFL